MSTRLVEAAALCVLPAGCASSGGEVLDPWQDASKRTLGSTGLASPSPFPWTDCNTIPAGDALDYSDTRCNSEDLDYFTVDCTDGTYVHLSHPGMGDLEGVDGVRPWREAAPLDPARGRTDWAFENCREHG